MDHMAGHDDYDEQQSQSHSQPQFNIPYTLDVSDGSGVSSFQKSAVAELTCARPRIMTLLWGSP